MTMELETWLRQATRGLSRDSAARVRAEIGEHYELGHEAAIHTGVTEEEAGRVAVAALGDARTARCQYSHVLLTSSEAGMLRDARREGRVFCSRAWVKWGLLAIPGAALMASFVFGLIGALPAARAFFIAAAVTGFLFATPLLPIYTPSRARAWRAMKWVVLVTTLALLFWPDPLKWSWLLASCLWPMVWMESTRRSIRRKLPVSEWPKALYL